MTIHETPGIEPFDRAEYDKRVERARSLMTEVELDGLLVTSEHSFRYLTGFTTQLWLSPTRPYYFVLPRDGDPVAVIPEVAVEPLQRTSWVSEIRTWVSPRPEDEGVSLVAGVLHALDRRSGRIGIELGPETRLGITAQDFLNLRDAIAPLTFADGSVVMRRLRMVKSPQEVARIGRICQIVSDAFEALPAMFAAGDTERTLSSKFQADLIARGADKAPYLIGVSGPGSYPDAMTAPGDRALQTGDVFVIDTGSTYDGYYCDFNRNWAIGRASDAARRAYDVMYRATEAGIGVVRPGARACDLYRAQLAVIEEAGMEGLGGRMGHGIGLQLTEPPSNREDDETVLEPGMVITIEPGVYFAPSQLMLHEENLVVTEGGHELLTRRATPELQVVDL